MINIYEEFVESDFVGTIIDVESIGRFDGLNYPDFDTRQYRHAPTILGSITKKGLKIHYVEKKQEIEALIGKIPEILSELQRPFYAFNACFETSVFYNNCDVKIMFDHELTEDHYEPKWKAVRNLGIDNYDDPFHDDGKLCMKLGEGERSLIV